MKVGENLNMPYPPCRRSIKTYARGNNDAPSITKYGSPVWLDAQIVALRAHCAKGAPFMGPPTPVPHDIQFLRPPCPPWHGLGSPCFCTKSLHCSPKSCFPTLFTKVHPCYEIFGKVFGPRARVSASAPLYCVGGLSLLQKRNLYPLRATGGRNVHFVVHSCLIDLAAE